MKFEDSRASETIPPFPSKAKAGDDGSRFNNAMEDSCLRQKANDWRLRIKGPASPPLLLRVTRLAKDDMKGMNQISLSPSSAMHGYCVEE